MGIGACVGTLTPADGAVVAGAGELGMAGLAATGLAAAATGAVGTAAVGAGLGTAAGAVAEAAGTADGAVGIAAGEAVASELTAAAGVAIGVGAGASLGVAPAVDWLSSGMSTPIPQCGQTPRFPAKNDLTFSLRLQAWHKNLMPMLAPLVGIPFPQSSLVQSPLYLSHPNCEA